MSKVTILIIAIFSLAVGLVMGIFLASQYYQLPEAEEERTEKEIATPIQSALISSWRAIIQGEVERISGREITLRANNDTLSIVIDQNVEVARLFQNEAAEGYSLEETDFESINLGDRVSVNARLEEGEIIGKNITILPELTEAGQ